MDSEYLEEVIHVDSLEDIVKATIGQPSIGLVYALGDNFYTLDSLFSFTRKGRRVVLLASRPGLNRALKELLKDRYIVVKREMKAVTYRSILLYFNTTGRIRFSFSLHRLARFPAVVVAPNTSVKKTIMLMHENNSIAVGIRVRGKISKVLTIVDFLNYSLEKGYCNREILLDDTPVSRVRPIVIRDTRDLASNITDALKRYGAALIQGNEEFLIDESSLRKYLIARISGNML
jgi:CBS domain-containing protein